MRVMSATTAVRAARQRGAAAVDAPASATQIHAQADVATTEVMREALEAVGEDEFRRRAQAKIEALSRHGRFAVSESMLVEATAREVVAQSRRAPGAPVPAAAVPPNQAVRAPSLLDGAWVRRSESALDLARAMKQMIQEAACARIDQWSSQGRLTPAEADELTEVVRSHGVEAGNAWLRARQGEALPEGDGVPGADEPMHEAVERHAS